MSASARHRKRSCRQLKRRARKIHNRRKRKTARRKLPARCKAPARVKGPLKPHKPVLNAGTQPVATMVAPAASGTPAAKQPQAAPPTGASSPIAVYSGTFGLRQAERLLWRAGFGPRPGQAIELAALGLDAAVFSLTRPSGEAVLDGPDPVVGGGPLDPYATYGHDHLWWLDRMVRSRHQLVERLTLVFHDWFATSNAGVGSRLFMLTQNNLFRGTGLGSFKTLVRAVTQDPAMLLWLSGLNNRKGAINENYGRELMELFTLGADRGAYTESDVRELARALSGWRADYDSSQGYVNFRFDDARWDAGTKTAFGSSGAFTWEDACRMVVDHPLHASFFVSKLWSYFVPTPPSDATAAALAQAYVAGGHEVRPVLEAILRSPELYTGPRMVKPPAVFCAGLLRALGRTIDTDVWTWMGAQAGQQLFYPPDVSGWDDTRWLDTSTMAGRWQLVNEAMRGRTTKPSSSYPAQTPDAALVAARTLWNDPPLTDETVASLQEWAAGAIAATASGSVRASRANALQMLVGMSPDHQVA